MPGSTTPSGPGTPTPTLPRGPLTPSSGSLGPAAVAEADAALQRLRDALSKANVSQAAADQVIQQTQQQQLQQEVWTGYVTYVTTDLRK